MALVVIVVGGGLVAAGWLLGWRDRPQWVVRGVWGIGFVLLIAGLLIDTGTDANADTEELVILAAAVGLLIASAASFFFRAGDTAARQHVRLGGLATGLVLLVLAVLVPAFATQRTLPDDPAARPAVSATLTAQERALNIFTRVTEVIAVQIGQDAETVAANLDAGISVAQMAREAEADLDQIVLDISAILREQVEATVADGRLTDFQAALLISQMPLIVRLGVETDLTGALSRFEPPESTPEAAGE